MKKTATRLVLSLLTAALCGVFFAGSALARPNLNPPSPSISPPPTDGILDDLLDGILDGDGNTGGDLDGDNASRPESLDDDPLEDPSEEPEQSEEPEPSAESSAEPESSEEPRASVRAGDRQNDSNPPDFMGLLAEHWHWFAIGAGAVILGVTLAVVFRKKRKAAYMPAPRSVQPDIPPAQAVPDAPESPTVAITPTVAPSPPSPTADPISIGNAHHIGMRENQQDCFVISDISNKELCAQKGVLGVVADGMGGMADGAEVSAIAAQTMLQQFNELPPSGQPELDLLNMLYAANDNVNRFVSDREKGGSTIVSVIIRDKYLYWAAVGDSRICLIRNGAVMQVNREHTYAVDLDAKAATGEISWEEASGDPKRAALTSYLGMGKLELVDRSLRPMQLLDGDRVLLMSDGIFGVLSDAEILSTMQLPPQESALKLQELVLGKQNPNQDNFTAIIFEHRDV
jgi:serine/threonine protein phosphatase PrpC